jgi:hypothetical protein
MRDFSSLHSMGKFSTSVLSGCPQSDIFPGMIKIPYGESCAQTEQKTPLIKNKPHQKVTSKESLNTQNILPIGVAALVGFAVGKTAGKITERPIDNLPAGLIGASVCGLAMFGSSAFYIAKYGGFFDKDRDYKTMFKNL